MKLFRTGKDKHCTIHGKGTRTASRTLLSLVLLAVLLIVWHVWVFGLSNPQSASGAAGRGFVVRLGAEVWDLLFNPAGIVGEMLEVLPYFLVGILIAGFIRTYKLATRMQRSLSRFGFLSIFAAAALGVLSPLCACGILTTVISLLFADLPMAPIMALLVSSPLMSPTTYLVSLNDLGPEWTLIRTIAAFSMGIFAGLLTHLLRNRGFKTADLFIDGVIPRGDFHDENYPREDLRCSCRERLGHRVAARTGNKFLILLAKSGEMLWPVGKYVLIGIALGTIIEWYVPPSWIYSLFGRNDPLNIVWITLGSIPIFLHQISASGILYHIRSGLDGTLNGGAAMAFLIGGPVTAVPTMTMLWALFRKRLFFLYMAICFVGTVSLAYFFQYFVLVPHVDIGNPLLWGVGTISGGPAAVITKKDKDVRIVMDPGDRNLVAVYTDYLARLGPVVFDAGRGPFLRKSFARYDNARYLRNIATWLEDSGTSARHGNILVYDLSTGADPDARILDSAALERFGRQNGFAITRTDRRETPTLTAPLLRDRSQVWIISGPEGTGVSFAPAELEAITEFSENGGGLLIVAAPRPKPAATTAANQVAAAFGVNFSGKTILGDKIPISTTAYFSGRLAEILGKFYRLER